MTRNNLVRISITAVAYSGSSFSCFGPIRQYFSLKRRLLRASFYCTTLVTRFVAQHEIT